VLVGQVDDGLGLPGSGADAAQVVEVASADLRALGLKGGG